MRIFRLSIAIFLFIVGSVHIVKSQHLTQSDLILQPSELLSDDLLGGGNEAFISQNGAANEVELIQNRDEAALLTNLTRLLQSGQGNVAWIMQEGSGNQLALIQYGDLNTYELVSQGYDNNIVVIQNGDGNNIVQQLIDSNQINVEFIQEGNNNEIIQVLDGISGGDYAIRQVGDGLKLIIKQSSF